MIATDGIPTATRAALIFKSINIRQQVELERSGKATFIVYDLSGEPVCFASLPEARKAAEFLETGEVFDAIFQNLV